jgi:predicted nucleic acid-binding protein
VIVLDTNVVSELMRAAPDSAVTECLHAKPQNLLTITAISVAEILYGIRRLETGRRRADLEKRFQALMERGFRRRLLLFDEAAADAYSGIMADRRRIGRSIEVLDAMIAGIALSRGAKVATRNMSHFVDCGVEVINPWEP